MSQQRNQDNAGDDFYVGYLPLPASHRRWLRFVVPALLWALVAVAALALKSFRPAGDGEWNTASLQSWNGVLRFAPYPMLHREVDGELQEWLLVEASKVAADARARPFDGEAVQVRGYTLQREGRQMIELDVADDAIARDGRASQSIPAPVEVSRGSVELVGEILDSKCYLGAMRPGDGLTHQACARLCIDGGIPPMLVVRSKAGAPHFYLLETSDGLAANDSVRDYVGLPARVRGEWLTRGQHSVLRLASSDPIAMH